MGGRMQAPYSNIAISPASRQSSFSMWLEVRRVDRCILIVKVDNQRNSPHICACDQSCSRDRRAERRGRKKNWERECAVGELTDAAATVDYLWWEVQTLFSEVVVEVQRV